MMNTDLVSPRQSTVCDSDLGASWKARRRAEMVQEVYIHALIFVVINAALFAINWLTRNGNGSWWFVWPLLIWGTVLIIHALATAACFRLGPQNGAPDIISKRDS